MKEQTTPGTFLLDGQPVTADTLDVKLAAADPHQGMTLELTIAPDMCVAIAREAQRMIETLAEVVQKLREWALELLRAVAAKAAQVFDKLLDAAMKATNSNPKWWHLYKHARRARTRKKYRRILKRQLYAAVAAASP